MAARLTEAAETLRRQFDDAFWCDDLSTYAIALDGEKRQVQSAASNAGHLLFSRAIAGTRARQVARKLMAPDSFSGWGIRTLAKGQRAYNPLSYHNGTVWPHDNSLIAMGFSNYGMQKLAAQVLVGVYEACRQFRHYRLPELFCGMGSGEGALVVSYPVSCSPQAWASGALFLLLRASLGLYPDAPQRTLRIVNPQLPPFLNELTLEGLRVGSTRITLRFERRGEGTFAAVREMHGEPLVTRIEVGAHPEDR
jgi:glycogen debranching enzyme